MVIGLFFLTNRIDSQNVKQEIGLIEWEQLLGHVASNYIELVSTTKNACLDKKIKNPESIELKY